MKPVLVLKQAQISPTALNMAASGAASGNLGSALTQLGSSLVSQQKDPIGGRPLLAPQGVQYQLPENPYGAFSSQGVFDSAPMISSNIDPKSTTVDENARADLRRLGHDPSEISRIPMGPERDAWAQRRAEKFDADEQKRQAGMSLQENLARGVAGRTGDTQEAFDTAMQHVGRGATAGKIGAGALAGLTGLMALQRANESGTDLISALGGAGAQGYSTYRYANPTLQSLGMRGAARFSPNISQPTSPSGGNTSLPPTISPGATPTTATPTATPTLPKAGSTGQTTWEDWTPDHGDHGVEMRVAEHGPSDHSSAITNEQENEVINNYQNMDISQNPFHRPTDWRDADTDWDENAPTTAGPTTESERRELEMRNEYHQMFKGNRRSFVGVR
jgi:hypothetical protein